MRATKEPESVDKYHMYRVLGNLNHHTFQHPETPRCIHVLKGEVCRHIIEVYGTTMLLEEDGVYGASAGGKDFFAKKGRAY